MGKFKVVIYSWPESQICMECRFGDFLGSDNYGPSSYACEKAFMGNDGISCKKMTPKDPEDIESI